MTQTVAPLPALAQQAPDEFILREQARRSFRLFLTFAKVKEGRFGAVPYLIPPHIDEIARALDDPIGPQQTKLEYHEEDPIPRSFVFLKSRQVYMSWTAAARAVHISGMNPTLDTICFSLNEKAMISFIKKCKFVAENLPEFFGVKIKRATQDQIEFENGSLITGFASTEDAGRGERNGLVIVDEAASHPYAEENLQSYQPTIANHPRGQALIISTAKGQSGLFWNQWNDSKFGKFFIPWNTPGIPGRNEKWLEEQKAQFEGLIDTFPQEYPETEEEAFLSYSGLVWKDFNEERNTRRIPPASWKEARLRVAGIDPGGSDPNAVSILGLHPDGWFVHDLMYDRGTISVTDIGDWLQRHHKVAPFDIIVGDFGKKSPWVAELRRMLPGKNRRHIVFGAKKDPKARRGLIGRLLRSGSLKMHEEHAKELIHEFKTTWWREGTVSNLVRTDGSHHADGADATGYAIEAGYSALAANRGQRRIIYDEKKPKLDLDQEIMAEVKQIEKDLRDEREQRLKELARR